MARLIVFSVVAWGILFAALAYIYRMTGEADRVRKPRMAIRKPKRVARK